MDIHCTLTLCSLNRNHTRKSTTNACTYLAFRRQLVRKRCMQKTLVIYLYIGFLTLNPRGRIKKIVQQIQMSICSHISLLDRGDKEVVLFTVSQYDGPGVLQHPLVPYHLTLVNWLSLSPRVTVQVRLLQHDLMYGHLLARGVHLVAQSATPRDTVNFISS